jgi:hypothetical protein
VKKRRIGRTTQPTKSRCGKEVPVKFWMICSQSIWISLVAVLVAVGSMGCDGGDDDPSVAPPEAQVNEQEDGEEADLSNPEDPNFPDGLHPSGSATRTIA